MPFELVDRVACADQRMPRGPGARPRAPRLSRAADRSCAARDRAAAHVRAGAGARAEGFRLVDAGATGDRGRHRCRERVDALVALVHRRQRGDRRGALVDAVGDMRQQGRHRPDLDEDAGAGLGGGVDGLREADRAHGRCATNSSHPSGRRPSPRGHRRDEGRAWGPAMGEAHEAAQERQLDRASARCGRGRRDRACGCEPCGAARRRRACRSTRRRRRR